MKVIYVSLAFNFLFSITARIASAEPQFLLKVNWSSVKYPTTLLSILLYINLVIVFQACGNRHIVR